MKFKLNLNFNYTLLSNRAVPKKFLILANFLNCQQLFFILAKLSFWPKVLTNLPIKNASLWLRKFNFA